SRPTDTPIASTHLPIHQFRFENPQFIRPLSIFEQPNSFYLPRILLTSILVLLCLAVTAQPKQYSFMHHGTSEGLSSHEVYSIVQDSEGYMWIGTNNGLQRFDGIRYRSFRANKNDPQGIPHNHVLQLLYDKNKNLWMLTNDGKVGRFDTRTFRYIESKVTLAKESTLTAE